MMLGVMIGVEYPSFEHQQILIPWAVGCPQIEKRKAVCNAGWLNETSSFKERIVQYAMGDRGPFLHLAPWDSIVAVDWIGNSRRSF
jgi:hypothetical protein